MFSSTLQISSGASLILHNVLRFLFSLFFAYFTRIDFDFLHFGHVILSILHHATPYLKFSINNLSTFIAHSVCVTKLSSFAHTRWLLAASHIWRCMKYTNPLMWVLAKYIKSDRTTISFQCVIYYNTILRFCEENYNYFGMPTYLFLVHSKLVWDV